MFVKKKERYKIKLIHSLLVVRAKGTHIAMQSALLADPKALPFGTRLRTFLLKKGHPDPFSLRKNPLRVQVPLLYFIKKETYLAAGFIFYGA